MLFLDARSVAVGGCVAWRGMSPDFMVNSGDARERGRREGRVRLKGAAAAIERVEYHFTVAAAAAIT